MQHPICVQCGIEIKGPAHASMLKKGYLDEKCNTKEGKKPT